MDVRIGVRVSLLEAARLALEECLTEVRETCTHEVVTEAPYHSLPYSAGFPPRRICLSCRLEEVGSHWSGGDIWRCEEGETVLGNKEGRHVTTTRDRDAFYALRIRA